MTSSHSYDPTQCEAIFDAYAAIEVASQRPYAPLQTGLLSLDLALGGGLAPGVIELYGPPSTGKTALLGQCIAHAQANGTPCAFLGSERLDSPYYVNLGVDLTQLPILFSATQVQDFLQSFPEACLAIDSLSGLLEICDEDLFDFTQSIRDFMNPRQYVIASSHVRSQCSVDPRRTYTGQLRSASWRLSGLFDVRLRIGRKDVSPPSYTQTVFVEANTLGVPGAKVELQSTMGFGADRFVDLVLCATSAGVLERRGTYYFCAEQRLGPGLQTAAEQLRTSQALESVVVARFLKSIGG